MKRTQRISRWLSILATLCALAPATAFGAWTMPVQGMLTDSDGVPVEGLVEASFSLYGAEADTVPLWAELVTLDVRDGAFTTYLGQAAPVMPQFEAANGPLWLGVAIDGGSEMGRMPLGAVPYAARAAIVETIPIHEHATGGGSGGTPVSKSCPTGEFLTGFDANGGLLCAPAGGGGNYALSGTSCAIGQMMIGVDANGYPLCASVPSSGGGGLSAQSCASDEVVTGVLSNGSLACEDLDDLDIVTADGTNKRLAKFTGDHTLDDSMVTDTGSKVGVNQTSPQKTLDVKGDLKVSGDFLWGGNDFSSSSCVVIGGTSCSTACSQHSMSCYKAWVVGGDSTSTSCSQSGFKFCCCKN